jgi:PAS domain S-box-containing protein
MSSRPSSDLVSADIEDYERLRLCFRALGSGIWDYDVTADILYCNRRWHHILGLSDDQARVTCVSAFRHYIHPEDMERATRFNSAELSRMIERDERYHMEFRIVRPDSEVRWIRSVASLVRNGSGHLRAVGCITDITDFRDVYPAHEGLNDASSAELAYPNGLRQVPMGSFDDPGAISLTGKERECLQWVSIGKTAWETAAILSRSQRTIEFHLNNAVRKLNAANKVHAAVIAIRKGLL